MLELAIFTSSEGDLRLYYPLKKYHIAPNAVTAGLWSLMSCFLNGVPQKIDHPHEGCHERLCMQWQQATGTHTENALQWCPDVGVMKLVGGPKMAICASKGRWSSANC